MFKKAIHKIAAHHHPWRHMKFDELAEVYTSMSLRSLGFSLIGIFVPVYLYTNGVSLRGIFLFFVFFFFFRIPLSFIAGKIVGRIGPKHTIAVSIIVTIAFLLQLLSYEQVGWSLAMMAFMFTFSNGLFFTAYHTDFSKIQHKQHGGKELGWLYVFERFGAAIGPLVGGIIASLIAPQATIVLAILVLVGSLVPLFLTNEPVKVHQHIKYRGFNQKKYARNYLSFSIFNVVIAAHGAFWPLLIAVFIFADDVYAKVGFLIGISMAVSMFAAKMYGRFIDANRGRALLTYGIIMNVPLYTSYGLVSTGAGAFVASSLGEPVMLAYRMPLTKAYYDEADQIESQRIVYIVWGEVWGALAKTVYTSVLLLATFAFDSVSVLRYQFIVIGIIGLLALTQRYPTLRRV